MSCVFHTMKKYEKHAIHDTRPREGSGSGRRSIGGLWPPRKMRTCDLISIRISSDVITDIKWLAWHLDVPYQSYLKIMLHQKVREEKIRFIKSQKKLTEALKL